MGNRSACALIQKYSPNFSPRHKGFGHSIDGRRNSCNEQQRYDKPSQNSQETTHHEISEPVAVNDTFAVLAYTVTTSVALRAIPSVRMMLSFAGTATS